MQNTIYMQQVKSIEPAGANTSRGLNSIFLLASVFITGSCVLIIEILAIRLLSPYYGNTIYTTSSVLGIVLAALSLGYYFGGKLADNRPSHSLFYGIIFASGILTVLTHVLGNAFLPSLSAFSIFSLDDFDKLPWCAPIPLLPGEASEVSPVSV